MLNKPRSRIPAGMVRPLAPLLLCLFVPMAARANPCLLNPSSLIAFGVVALAALVVEAGLVALVLAFAGLSPLRFFFGFFFANGAVFLFVFCPLLENQTLPWLALEFLVVAIDAVAIRMLAGFALLQGDGYCGVRWRLATVAALVGNAASFFVGVLATDAPWLVHTVPE